MNADTRFVIVIIIIMFGMFIGGMSLVGHRINKDAEIGYKAWSRNYPQYELTFTEWKILRSSKSLPR